MPFAAVLFDLFDTLVLFDSRRLPEVDLGGRRVRSSVGRLHELLGPYAPGVTIERCYDALIWSWKEAERLRAVDHREVPAPVRFGRWLERLSVDRTACPPDLVSSLLEAHRSELMKAAEFPAHHGPLLRRLAERVPLAVVSNFDYTPTALAILEAAGVADVFRAIVVSDQVGWRKPKRDIFEVALAKLGVEPERALFVGDRADIDVLGAQALGMPVAWVNRNGEALPRDVPPPTFEIRDLAELDAIVAGRAPRVR